MDNYVIVLYSILLLLIVITILYILQLVLCVKNCNTTDIHTTNNCIKLNIEGNNVREWVNCTFTIDGIKYDTEKRFISNHKSNLVNNDSVVKNNLMITDVWKNGKYIYLPTLINQNSNVNVELMFLKSDFYPTTQILSYKAEVVNCL